MLFNDTSKVIHIHSEVGMSGVILPYSSRLLIESDINKKIKKIKNHIDHLFKAQSHRNTHGGKRFRTRQILLRDQIDFSSKRLMLLKSAKEILVKSNKERFLKTLLKVNAVSNCNTIPISYTEGPSVYTSFFGGRRKITLYHPNYL